MALVEQLASWKINQLQLYTEHAFAYHGHEEVWRDAGALSAEEIRQLDSHCKANFIELVPNQNSFGHMRRWLKHPRYTELAEVPENPWALCPTDPRSLELLGDLYRQLLPNFSSRLFNVGCDETFDLGAGRSREQCERRGKAQVYLDFLNGIHRLIESHRRQMMFWADIALAHPQVVAGLPCDCVALNWGYEADHPFEAETRVLANAGLRFYVCPGTSSWNSIAGRTDNMLANQVAAASAGLRNGAAGYLNTDWGDYGHLQYLPISFAGFAVGAAHSWCLRSNREMPLAAALNLHVFCDEANVMGQLALDLGNVYRAVKKQAPNRSALFGLLVPSSSKTDAARDVTAEDLSAASAAIDAAMARLSKSRMNRPDSRLIRDEFTNAAAMLKYACGRDADALPAIVESHRRLWLARNRPGGLEDSVARLTNVAGKFELC
jgi:hypothetical protein